MFEAHSMHCAVAYATSVQSTTMDVGMRMVDVLSWCSKLED
jgi:hypothetical protein